MVTSRGRWTALGSRDRVVNRMVWFLAQEGLQTSSDSGAVVVERC